MMEASFHIAQGVRCPGRARATTVVDNLATLIHRDKKFLRKFARFSLGKATPLDIMP